MQEKTCRCGASKKRFKKDIGEFYIAECCEKAGFDHLGREKLPEGESPNLTQEESSQLDSLVDQAGAKPEPSVLGKIGALVGIKPGRGKLRDMTKDALVKLAQEKGLSVQEEMTKNQIIDLILG